MTDHSPTPWTRYPSRHTLRQTIFYDANQRLIAVVEGFHNHRLANAVLFELGPRMRDFIENCSFMIFTNFSAPIIPSLSRKTNLLLLCAARPAPSNRRCSNVSGRSWTRLGSELWTISRTKAHKLAAQGAVNIRLEHLEPPQYGLQLVADMPKKDVE